jgi:hypothetical protein
MEIFKDPTIVAYILVMPLLIIGIAKFWKRIKDKKAAAKDAAGTPNT